MPCWRSTWTRVPSSGRSSCFRRTSSSAAADVLVDAAPLSRAAWSGFRLRQLADARDLAGGRDLIVIGQKSGIGWAIDPDQRGAVVWQYRAGQGAALWRDGMGLRGRRTARLFPGRRFPLSATRRAARGAAGPPASASGTRRRRRRSAAAARAATALNLPPSPSFPASCFRARTTAPCAPTRRAPGPSSGSSIRTGSSRRSTA